MSENDETIITPQGEQPKPEQGAEATEPSTSEMDLPTAESILSGLEEPLDAVEPETPVDEPVAEELLAEEPIPPIDEPPPLEASPPDEPSPPDEVDNGGTNWVLIVVVVALVIICCCCLAVVGIAAGIITMGGSAAGDFYSSVIMALSPLMA